MLFRQTTKLAQKKRIWGVPLDSDFAKDLIAGSRLLEGRQEDAEEFLGYLLNGLNDEMQEVRVINYYLFLCCTIAYNETTFVTYR